MLKCKLCGGTEKNICRHEWVNMPKGCICNPKSWDTEKVPPVCSSFIQGRYGNCSNCEHDEACHKNKPESDKPAQRVTIARTRLDGTEAEYEVILETGTRKEVLIALHYSDDDVHSRYVDVETLIDFLGGGQ